jgi:hypothetical protein
MERSKRKKRKKKGKKKASNTCKNQIMNHIAITKSMNEYGKKENKIWEERKGCFLCF